MTAQGRSSCPAIHDIGCCDGWGREQASVSHYFLLLRHGHNRSRSKQFQYVVAQADQFPFRSHFLQSTEKKSAEASPLLDLSKHWFYDRLPPAVHCPSRFAHQLLSHLLPQRNRAISLGVPLFSR